MVKELAKQGLLTVNGLQGRHIPEMELLSRQPSSGGLTTRGAAPSILCAIEDLFTVVPLVVFNLAVLITRLEYRSALRTETRWSIRTSVGCQRSERGFTSGRHDS
jgi:hypothetical protein